MTIYIPSAQEKGSIQKESYSTLFFQGTLFRELKHFTFKPFSLKCTSFAFHCADRSTIARVIELLLQIYIHIVRSRPLKNQTPENGLKENMDEQQQFQRKQKADSGNYFQKIPKALLAEHSELPFQIEARCESIIWNCIKRARLSQKVPNGLLPLN